MKSNGKGVLDEEYDRWLGRASILAIAVIVIAVLVLKTNIVFIEPSNTHYYTDVAEWVQDAEQNIPESEKRHTFVASVYAFLDDNTISTKEYRIIKRSYEDLKQSIALTSIHDNIKLMRAPNEFSLLTPRLESDATETNPSTGLDQ